jgi:hypothetical protein
VIICQARQELDAETARLAARERQEAAAGSEDAAQKAPEEDQRERNTKAERARENAEAAWHLAMEKAELAGLEPPDLPPLGSAPMPRRPDRQIMTSNGETIQGCNCQAVLDDDHQVIVVLGVSNQRPAARPTAIGHNRPTSKDLDVKGRMARTLRTTKGRELHAKRKMVPEPV